MNCKYCGQQIFYFSCDCGSKVFFDELCSDWPEHDCTGYYSEPIEDKVSNSEVIKYNEKISWTLITADEIDEGYKEKINVNKKYLYSSNVPILFIESKKDKNITITGTVTEIVNTIDIYKIFNLKDNNTIGANLVKEFTKGTYQQITIHTYNLEERNKDSYTALVLESVMKKQNIGKKDTVILNLTGKQVLGINKWVCTEIEKIDAF